MENSPKFVTRHGDTNAEWQEQHCLLDLPTFNERDVLHLKRTLNYPVAGVSPNQREVMVEVDLHFRFTRETGELLLGDPIYAQTLLPGESVRLATSSRRTRFSFDSESNLSYKSVQMSESQYYLSALRHFTADSEATQQGSNSNDYRSNWDFHGDAEGGIDILSLGASASTNARGSFNSHSFSEYLANQRYHAETAESNSVEATQKSMSVSVGEVNTRLHQEGTSEDHFESTSRSFTNHNLCHALTYLFYRINKKQTVKFELVSMEFRIKDPNSLTSTSFLRPGGRTVRLVPQQLPATSKKVLEALEVENRYYANLVNRPDVPNPTGGEVNIPRPLYTADVRREAIERVKKELITEGILKEDGSISPKYAEKVNFTKESALPTAGVVVKGYLDDCDTCEPLLRERYETENEHLKLKNELLKKQIELLEKSKEYRCCGAEEEEED